MTSGTAVFPFSSRNAASHSRRFEDGFTLIVVLRAADDLAEQVEDAAQSIAAGTLADCKESSRAVCKSRITVGESSRISWLDVPNTISCRSKTRRAAVGESSGERGTPLRRDTRFLRTFLPVSTATVCPRPAGLAVSSARVETSALPDSWRYNAVAFSVIVRMRFLGGDGTGDSAGRGLGLLMALPS